MNELRTMHLFAGIGGGLLADLILGHKPVVAVEWEPYACRVLRERAAEGWFPGLYVWEGDVRLFDPSEYAGRVDCIHAGFPCQDISVAGKQAGVSEGTRSGLYREVLRIADAIRPKFIFLENVAAILSNGLGTVLGDLAAMGYDSRWCCIRASDVGAPHHRDRWFLLANSSGGRLGKSEGWKVEQPGGAKTERTGNVPDANSENGRTSGMGQNTGSDGRNQSIGLCEVFPDSGVHRCGDGSVQYLNWQLESATNIGDDGEKEFMADANNERREELHSPGISEIPGWNGGSNDVGWRESWWSIEPELGRVADGIPNRVGQLKGYGNAQVPIQAAAAFKFLHG